MPVVVEGRHEVLALLIRTLITLPMLGLVATGQEAAGIPDAFWNGDDRVSLGVFPGEFGVLFDAATTEAAARALVETMPGVQPGVARSFVFASGHVNALETVPGMSAQAAVDAARAIQWLPGVASVSPRLFAEGDPVFLTDELLVRWRPGTSQADIAGLEASHGLSFVEPLRYSENPGFVYRLPHGRSMDAVGIGNALHETGLVEFAVPDFSLARVLMDIPDDPRFVDQWHLHSTGQTAALVDADVDAPEAWDITRGDPSVIIAVVDTGVELTHNDLKNNLLPGTDVLDNDNDPKAEDFLFGLVQEKHSTSVCGVSAAQGFNGLGVSGAAPECGIIPIRFLSEWIFAGSPTTQDEVDAFNFAVAGGASVINNSWGPLTTFGSVPLPAPTKAAIDNANQNGRGGLGTMIFFASGNEGASVSNNGYAKYSGTVAVSASTDKDKLASYSNTGPEINVCAPSNGGSTSGIWTTDRKGSKGYSSGDYTGLFGGTSSASPLAAGVACLVFSANPWIEWETALDILELTADKIDPAAGNYGADGHSNKFGHGKVNAHRAVLAAQGSPPFGVAHYGAGTAGTDGQVPAINASGLPKSGSAIFALTLRDAAPGAAAILVVGAGKAEIPLLGGTLLVDPTGPMALATVVADGSGFAGAPIPIPDTGALVGQAVDAQWVVIDAGGPQGLAFSRGLEATILP